MVGIFLLTLGGNGFSFSMTSGELLSLLAAMLYAIAIILTDRLSRKDDSLLLGILQVVALVELYHFAAAVFVGHYLITHRHSPFG